MNCHTADGLKRLPPVGEIRDLWPCRTFGPWCLSHKWHVV